MKKLIIFSLFVVSSASMTSCTTDSIADSVPSQTIQLGDTGGQNNPLPPPPPPPPSVGSGG